MISEFTEGDTVLYLNDQIIILDRRGYELYKKYGTGKCGWKISFANPHLHRREPIGLDCNGNIIYRTILFYRELLGLEDKRCIIFLNANKLDLRVSNFP